MTSTNDGNEVNSNQRSGQRNKSYYIELYKSLEARLNAECSLEERTTHLCEAWRRVYSLYQHSAPSTHPHLSSWLQRHTASTVLQSKWAESKSEHARLTAAIDSLVAEVQAAAAGRDTQPWEQLLLQRASWFRKALENPWGHPVLKSLINPNGEPVTDQQVLEWLVEERGIVLATRLRQLVSAGNCDDLALLLASAVMDRARAATPRQPDDASDEKAAEPEDTTSFVAVLERDASFTTEVWELLTDIELVLLLKTDKRPRCIELAKLAPLRYGYAMIERLRNRLNTSPRDKKLWKHAKEVATLVTQVIIARCMVLPKCAGVGRAALYCCARSLARLVPPGRLPAVSNTLAAAAATARHLHTFCTALDAQCSADMKPFICELYVRAITAGMNELEQLKLNAEKPLEARTCEQMLASWFSQLGGLLDGSGRLRAECALTAFSVHPAPNFYERVADMPQPPTLTPAQEPAPETTSEFGSWANDSRTQSSLVKTSETLQMKQTDQHQANVLSTAVLTEGETLGLEPELCQDLAVLLSGPRVKTLSWDMDREALLQNCRSYMERTHGGTRAVTTELKYLNLDPSAYRHLPEEDDEETGIERGYEHELQMEAPEETYIWQDAFFDDETVSAEDSEVEIQLSKLIKTSKKKSKASIVSSDDEDPLSCLADAKKEKKKIAKEKKEQRRKKTHKRDTSKDGNRDRRKDKDKKTKKESKDKSEQPTTGSLTSLLGMKVTNAPSPVQDGEKRVRKKKERRRDAPALFNYVSVTDSSYDSQEKKSDNDPNIVVDGVFSMDEIKSPERQIDSQTDIMKPTLKTYGIAQSTVINDIKSRPKLSSKVSSTSDDSDVSRSKSPYLTPNALGNRHVVSSKVKSSISKLLQFRRNKSLLRPVSKNPAPSTQPVAAQTLVGMKIYNPDEIPKVYTNKKPPEAISKDVYNSNLVSESSKMVSVNNRPQVPYSDTAKADNKLQNLYNVQRHSQEMQGMSQNMLNEKVHVEYVESNPSKIMQHSNYMTYKSPSNVYASHVSPVKTVDHVNQVLNLSPPKVTLAHQPFHKSLQNLSTDNMKHDSPKRPVLINDPNYHKHQQAKSNSQLSPRIKAPSQTATSGQYAKDDFTLSHSNLVSRGSAQNLNSEVTNLKSDVTRYGSKQLSSSMQNVNVLGSVDSDVTKNHVPSPHDMRLDPTSYPLTYNIKSHSDLSNTSQNFHISNNTSVSRCIPIQHRNRDVKTQQNVLPTQNNPGSGLKSNYQEFFDNLARSINAGSSEPGKNLSIALNKEVKVTPVQTPSTSVTAKRIDSTQCAKQLIQQKKTENAPNTFSRRSYMHKNKQNESKLLSDNLSLEFNKNTLDHKLIKAQCMKNNVTISRVNPIKQEQENNVNKIHQSSRKLQKACPLLTSMLDSPGKSLGDCPTAGNATTISQNVSENLTDREHADLLLLLRQQPVVKPNLNAIETLRSDIASSQNLSSTPTKILTPLVAINKTLMGAKVKNIGNTTTTILGNAPVNKESTPQDNAPQDWERVMDALLAHKTEPLGPNALDMVLKKDYKRPSQSSTRPQMSHKPRTCSQSSSHSRPDSKKREHQRSNPSTATRKPSTEKHSETLKRHRPSAETIRKASSTEMLKKVDVQNNKYVSANSSKDGDPFISGIPNSAYDMLGDLLDDDLRQELGELSSDEDSYSTPNVVMAKENSSYIPKTDTSVCKIANTAKDIPRIVDPQIIVHRIESNTVVSSSTTCSTTGYPNVITNNCSHQDASTLPEHRPTIVRSNIEQQHTATVITNQIVQPANMANHTIVGPNHFISNIDPTNVIIASVPVQQPVVVIRQDLVYDPYPTIRIHESQVNAGLCSVNQNVYAINTTPNIALYQTTQFAAPVVNPVIIGNAMTSTNVPADPVAMGDQQCTPDPINDGVKPQDQSNIDPAIASRLTEDNSEMPGKSTNLDFNMNKNCERKVLSQVQEKHLTENLDIDSHVRRLSVDDYSLTTDQDAERIKLKRQSLLNRKINHACYHPPIPLTYTPSSEKGNLGKLFQQETPKNGTIKPTLMSIENGTNDTEKRVSTNSNSVESSNSEVNNESMESTKQVSNAKENKESCRRIWLRSSNKLDDKVSPVKRTRIPLRRNKFKLKVTKKGIEKITDIKNENDEKVKNVPRISRRIRNKNMLNKSGNNVSSPNLKKNIKNNELLSHEKGKPPNQNQLQQNVVENGELIDFEEELSGSKILKISTALAETQEMSKAMDSNIIPSNEGIYTTERIEDESCDRKEEVQNNLDAIKETEVTPKSNKPTNNDLKPTVVIERLQNKVGNQLVIKSLAAKAVELPNDTNVMNVKENSPVTIPDKVEEEQADVSKVKAKDSKDKTECRKVTPELEVHDKSQTSTIGTESLNTNKTCATETSPKMMPKAANVIVQRKSNRLIKPISSGVYSQSNAEELIKTDSIISKSIDTNHTATIQTDCPTTIVIDQSQTKILPKTKETHLSGKDIGNTNSIGLTTNKIPQTKTNRNKSLLCNEKISDVLNKDSSSNTNAIIEKRDLPQPINCQPTNLCQKTNTRTLTDKSKNNDNSAATQANTNWARVENNENRKIYVNGDIKVEELPISETGVRQLRITLPSGKVFKATISGKMHGNFDFLFAQPAMKSLLAGHLSDGKRYTLKYTQVFRTNKADPNKVCGTQIHSMEIKNSTPVETVNLVSDDDDEDDVKAVAETRTFTTEFGKYTTEVDQETFNKHQIFFSQKCEVELVRPLDIDATKPKEKSSPVIKSSVLTRKQFKVLSDSTITTNIIAKVDSSVEDGDQVVTPVSMNSTDKTTATQETSTSTFKAMLPESELNRIKVVPDAMCSTNITPELNSNSKAGSQSGNKSTPAEDATTTRKLPTPAEETTTSGKLPTPAEETTTSGKLPNEHATNKPTLSQETPTPLRSLPSVNTTLSIRDQSKQAANTDTIPRADSFTEADDIDMPPVYLDNTVKSTHAQGAPTLLRSVSPVNNPLLTKNESNLDADATTTLMPKINSNTKDEDDVLPAVETTNESTSAPPQEQISSTSEVVKTTEIIEIDDSSNDSVESLTSNSDSCRNADPVADIIALKTTRLLQQNIGVKPTSKADINIVNPRQPSSLVPDNLKTALLQDLGIEPSEAPIIDITSDEEIEIPNVKQKPSNIKECVVKIMRCDNLVKRYELMKAMKRCYVKLERLNNSMLKTATVVSSDDDTNNKTDERKQDNDEDYIAFDDEETLGSPQLSRCPSLSILDHWDNEDLTSPKSPYRSSPVMEVYDAILQLHKELTDTELVYETENSCSLTCDSEWTVTKFGYRTQELLLSSLTPTIENKESEITLTSCDNITVSDEEKLFTTSKTPKLLTIVIKFLEKNPDLVYRMEYLRKTRDILINTPTNKLKRKIDISFEDTVANKIMKLGNLALNVLNSCLKTVGVNRISCNKDVENMNHKKRKMIKLESASNAINSFEQIKVSNENVDNLLHTPENLDVSTHFSTEVCRSNMAATVQETQNHKKVARVDPLPQNENNELETNEIDLEVNELNDQTFSSVTDDQNTDTHSNAGECAIALSVEKIDDSQIVDEIDLSNIENKKLETIQVEQKRHDDRSILTLVTEEEDCCSKDATATVENIEDAKQTVDSVILSNVESKMPDKNIMGQKTSIANTHSSAGECAMALSVEKIDDSQIVDEIDLSNIENKKLETIQVEQKGHDDRKILTLVTEEEDYCSKDATATVENNQDAKQNVDSVILPDIESKIPDKNITDQETSIANTHSSAGEYMTITVVKPIIDELLAHNEHNETEENKIDQIEVRCQNDDETLRMGKHEETSIFEDMNIATIETVPEGTEIAIKPKQDDLEYNTENISPKLNDNKENHSEGNYATSSSSSLSTSVNISVGPERVITHSSNAINITSDALLDEIPVDDLYNEGYEVEIVDSHGEENVNIVGSLCVRSPELAPEAIPVNDSLLKSPVFIDSKEILFNYHDYTKQPKRKENDINLSHECVTNQHNSDRLNEEGSGVKTKENIINLSHECVTNQHNSDRLNAEGSVKTKENIINLSHDCVTNQYNSDRLNEEGSGVKTAGSSLEVALKEDPASEDTPSNRNIENKIKESYHPKSKPECKYELIQEDDWLTVITTENEKEETEASSAFSSPNLLEDTVVVASVCSKNATINIKGFEYDDVYVFPLSERSHSNTSNDSISQELNGDVTVVSDLVKHDLHDIDFDVIKPSYTYTRKSLKRRISMTDVKVPDKKYRKGKNIDCVKQTVTGMIESAYSREYKRLLEYCSSVKFSYLRPFHKECVDAEDLIGKWPIIEACIDVPSDVAEEHLFANLEEVESFQPDPATQTLVEEISYKYEEADAALENPSSEANDANFNMGFGEGSGRVIQNLKKGGESNISAATLSDVKQSQPVFKSVDLDDYKNTDSTKDDLIIKLRKHLNFIELRDRVRSFFEKSSVELKKDWIQQNIKDNADLNWRYNDKIHAEEFPFDLCSLEYMKPIPTETVVQVVQVGQLPVSAAAQNPVTCDPRVTQVSDASPSQCSVDNSPNDDSQSDIKTEYTELTTADLTLPLQEYAQHNQAMNLASHENNIEVTEQTISLEMEIKAEESPEIKEEMPDIKEEKSNSSDTELHTLTNATPEHMAYSFKNNEDKSDENSVIYEAPEQNDSETFSQQRHQNGTSEKTDQIAHAMNAAGITTTPETVTNTRAHALVNILSQKMRHGVNTTQTTTNTYSKTTSINAMALQQALAQILPPPLNQTGSSENNHAQSTPVGPQVLHIVQGKNASGNQITLVDNSQQSVISTPNATQVLHIVQNKSTSAGQASNGTLTSQTNSFSGLSLVDAGLQQGGNQLLHIVNTGNQKTGSPGQLLKRVNLLTNLTNVQGSNEQKMVQFVCKSADGKAIQLNAPHQRSMVLRLQPIETPAAKSAEAQEPSQSPTGSTSSKESASAQEIKSRSIYEENYAKFIQNSSSKTTGLEKATSLPKFNQAFGKPVFQEGSQKQGDTANTNSHLPAVNTNTENAEGQATENAINLEHIVPIGSPPLLIRKSTPTTSQSQSNIVQQIKQTIAPMNIQTMHGGVIYTRQIPVNIGGGQTINLITVPSTELINDETAKTQTTQGEIEPSIIKIVPQGQSTTNSETSQEDSNNHAGSSESAPTPQPQPVLTQMRIKLPMLSKAPQMVQGARVVRPSFFQIQRNVIGGANQPVYQQLVLTAAPPLGQQTIRLPQAQATRPVKVPSESQSSPSESQMSSSTLEQLREFDMVLEQVKERSTVQPTGNSNTNSFKIHTSSSDTTDGNGSSNCSTESTPQVLYSIGNNQSLNVAYVNRKTTVTTPTTSTYVRSPDSSGIADSPTSSTHINIPHTVTTDSSPTEMSSTSKPAKVGSKSKSRPKSTSNPPNTLKLSSSVPPKTSSQKPLEDEQTTQRILYILAEYKEQVENSPDKDKPAPRRRSNPPSNPGSSKRKKGSSSRRSGTRDMSPVHGEDTCRTMGSEDSSCGTSQGDCNESCLDSHSPQDSPRKVARKITFDQELNVTQPRPQPQRNVIVADGQTITVARSATGKPATAVLMPANYILPVSMVKGGQQIAIVTNRGPKLLAVGGEGGATNALLLQRLIGPAGLKPVLARPGVRHVRLPTAALHNLQAFNLATATTIQPPDSTASPTSGPTPPELVDTRATSSPWTDRDHDVKPERGSSPEGSEPWNLPSSADPHEYTYEETVRTDNMDRTVLDPIPDRYSPDMEAQRIFDKMFDVDSKKSYDGSPRYDIDPSDCDDKSYQVVQKKDGSQRQHRLSHVSAAALRHKYAILEHELRLQKSLSEECEDLGVDSPSASELFPEAELLFAASPAHEHNQDPHHSHTPQPIQSSIPQPDMDDQIATDHLIPRGIDVSQCLGDVGIVAVSEDGMQATIALDQEEFARSHPNTTFHSEPTEGEVQPFTITGLKGRHITSTIFHSNTAPATVLMTAPQTTVISQAPDHSVKYEIENMINQMPSAHNNDMNLSSVLVKDDGLTRFDSILTDSRELHLTNTASAIVHSSGNATQVIRRVCYEDDKRERDARFLIDEPDNLIAGDDAKMVAEDSSRDATLESMADVDDDRSSPERHAELFWESNSASERSESRRPLDFSSDSDKCCKSPFDETNSTDSSVGTHMRLDSVIKEARGRERSGSADGSSADDTHPPLRTYPPKRMYHPLEETERSLSGKTRAGERSPDSLEVRRRASGRGVVKRGCHCCNGEPAPPRPKKPRQRKPTLDFNTNN